MLPPRPPRCLRPSKPATKAWVALADLAIATYAAYERGVHSEYALDDSVGERQIAEAEAKWEALSNDACNLIEQVITANATSIDGFKAKLSVLGRIYLYGTKDYDEGFEGYKSDLVCSLMRDFGIPPRPVGSPDA